MKASEAKMLEFLKKWPQFVIPIYQRTYGWFALFCATQGIDSGLEVDRP